MSLVAYAASSDDESDNGDVEEPNQIKSAADKIDEEVFDAPTSPISSRGGLNLPVPKNTEHSNDKPSLFEVLPPPKVKSVQESVLIEEEDDEFLHKKATPTEIPKSALPAQTKNLVQITIPSLKEFDEMDDTKDKKPIGGKKSSKFSSLINILPRPKSEQSFIKTNSSTTSENSKPASTKPCLIPDAVKIRRPAQNTENVERTVHRKLPPKPEAKPSLVNVSDSEGSDLEGDFFSLTNDHKLPDVTADEISAMVSKKAAEMAHASSKFALMNEDNNSNEGSEIIEALPQPSQTQQLDKDAIQALIGSQAKRRKMDDVQVIDISSEEVLPNREEWLRTALASATTYQPTGVLTDEEPAAGTRRKHQITYLAHKAKANEAELQAMWSANRQNRRQTQSKYGF